MFDRVLGLLVKNSTKKTLKTRKSRGLQGQRRLRHEHLEDRRMLATLMVNTSIDQVGVIDDGTLTLREAIIYVNRTVQAGPLDIKSNGIVHIDLTEPFGQNDKIIFDASKPLLDGGTILLSAGTELDITKPVTIDASMLSSLTIDASGNGTRIFDIRISTTGTPKVTLEGLTLTGGDSHFAGGAISFRPSGTGVVELLIKESLIENNYADNGGGGVFVDRGTLNIIGTTFDNNRTSGNGGGIDVSGATASAIVTVNINSSQFINNFSEQGGGAINASAGTLDIRGESLFLNNTTAGTGGAVRFTDIDSATITDTDFVNNQANADGGALWVNFDKNVTSQSQELTITRSTFLDNKALGTVSFGEGGSGGGLFVNLRGTSSTTESTEPKFHFIESTAKKNVAAEDGGGIWVCAKHGAEFDLINSTVSGNIAGKVGEEPFPESPAPITGGHGGGLWLGFSPFSGSNALDAKLEQVTLSDNTALLQGGGVWLGNAHPETLVYGSIVANLNHVTITDNKSPGTKISDPLNGDVGEGAGLFSEADSRVSTTLSHTIVSGNVVSETDSTPNNVGGAIDLVDSKFNFLGSNNGFFDGLPAEGHPLYNIHNDDPELRPLGYYGGLTQTHYPFATSLVIDAGDPEFTPPPQFDQRGDPFDRVLNGQIDIGAVEYDSTAPRVTSVIISNTSPNAVVEPYDFSTATVPDLGTGNVEPVIGSGNQLRTVPVGGANTVEIVFSKPIDESTLESNLEVVGLFGGTVLNPEPGTFDYDPAALTAKWTFTSWNVADFYRISLDQAVTDLSGQALDGEWYNPTSVTIENTTVSEFPSGNGTAGGDFDFVVTILPGDFDLSNIVLGSDFAILQTHFNSTSEQTFTDGDANGDGGVTGADFGLLQIVFGMNFESIVAPVDLNGDGDMDRVDLDQALNDLDLEDLLWADWDSV